MLVGLIVTGRSRLSSSSVPALMSDSAFNLRKLETMGNSLIDPERLKKIRYRGLQRTRTWPFASECARLAVEVYLSIPRLERFLTSGRPKRAGPCHKTISEGALGPHPAPFLIRG